VTTTLIVGTDDGLVRLTNEGEASWTAASVLATAGIEAIAADPLRPELMYACAGSGGLWCSTDGGGTWEQGGAGITRPIVTAVTVSASDRVDGHGVVYVGTQMSAVFRSDDAGRTFTELTGFQTIPSRERWAFPPGPDTHHVCSLATAVDPDVLLVGVEQAGVLRTEDGGRTWTDLDPIADPDPHSMHVHPGAPGRVYLSGGVSYCQSDDSGRTWSRPVDGLNVCYFDRMAVAPGDPDTLVVSAGREPFSGHGVLPGVTPWSTVFRRTNGGTWREVTDGLPPRDGTPMGTFGTTPAEPLSFFYITPTGDLYRSADGGEQWREQTVSWPTKPGRRSVGAITGGQADG
jgi:photosystem II stability/assembly factor-like uncharacterized protein